MQPLLLAFVDSQAFGIITGFFLFLLALVAAVGLWLLLVLTRGGLRHWRRLRTAATPAAWWQYLGAALLLLPAAFVGFVGFCLLAGELLTTYQDRQATAAYQAALHQHLQAAVPAVAGRYVLAEATLPAPNPAWYQDQHGWPLADTAALATDRTNPGPCPRVELLLQANGTFTYRSNVVGDATGPQVAGRWRLAPSYWEQSEPRRLANLASLHNYSVLFYGTTADSTPYDHLRGALDTSQPSPTLSGTYQVRGSYQELPLHKAPATAVMHAP